MTMEQSAKQLTLPDITEAFMSTADVLLVLDDGTAIKCHSQILSMHSAVLCNMVADLRSQQNEMIKIPLADFTEAQCSALLTYMYCHGVSSKGAAFEKDDAAAMMLQRLWRDSLIPMTRPMLCGTFKST